MAGLIRLVTGLAVMAAALGGLDSAWPTWMDDVSRGQLRPSDESAPVIAAREREHDVIAERTAARHKLVRRLAAGEITLFEAAARFGELNRTPADVPDRGWRMIEGNCDGEKLCRQVIIWAEANLRTEVSAERVEALCRSWQKALDGHIARNGRVVLPE